MVSQHSPISSSGLRFSQRVASWALFSFYKSAFTSMPPGTTNSRCQSTTTHAQTHTMADANAYMLLWMHKYDPLLFLRADFAKNGSWISQQSCARRLSLAGCDVQRRQRLMTTILTSRRSWPKIDAPLDRNKSCEPFFHNFNPDESLYCHTGIWP